MRNIPAQLCKHYAALLPITQFRHFLNLHFSTDSKSTQILALFLSRIIRVQLFKKLERRQFLTIVVVKAMGILKHSSQVSYQMF